MATFWGRFMTAVRAGIQAYREQALIPTDETKWDDYESRLFRYWFNDAYYNNIAYRSLSKFSTALKHQQGLYKHIRGIYNPVARLTDLYVAKTYGGSLDFDTLTKGAIPIVTDHDALREAIKQLWIWSNWGTKKSLYVRNGAKLGDVGLWIVDDRRREKVRMEVIHPSKLHTVERDNVGNVKRVVFEYQDSRPDIDQGREYTYRLEVDKDHYATFKDGELYAFTEDMTGNKVKKWPNEYGFVPLSLAKHKDFGLEWGGPCFYPYQSQIDEINDAASLLNDNIRKHVNPIWQAPGAKASDLNLSGTTSDATATTDASAQRDKINVLYPPAGTEMKPLVASFDIAAAAANIAAMQDRLEDNLQELILDRTVDVNSQTSGKAIKNRSQPAIDKINEARGNYNDCLMRAHQMGVSIGGHRGYRGFEGFNLNSYARGELDHIIGERAYFDDGLDKQDKINVLSNLPERPEQARAVLNELDMPEDVIEKIVAEIAEVSESQIRNAARGFAESIFGSMEEDNGEETPSRTGVNESRTQAGVGAAGAGQPPGSSQTAA